MICAASQVLVYRIQQFTFDAKIKLHDTLISVHATRKQQKDGSPKRGLCNLGITR